MGKGDIEFVGLKMNMTLSSSLSGRHEVSEMKQYRTEQMRNWSHHCEEIWEMLAINWDRAGLLLMLPSEVSAGGGRNYSSRAS